MAAWNTPPSRCWLTNRRLLTSLPACRRMFTGTAWNNLYDTQPKEINNMSNELLFFGGFLLFIILMLAIDLGLFSKSNSAVSFKQAAIMSAVWVSFALGFYVILRIWGHE